MKLATIWTIRAMNLTERLHRTGDWVAFTLASKLPSRVRYWTFVQVGGAAIPENAEVPAVTFMDVLANAEEDRHVDQ